MVGFADDEINTAEPTRSARLKWVIAVRSDLPAGLATNAAACVAAATGAGVSGVLGPDAIDGDGSVHPGLPWAGCTILGATAAELAELRARATGAEGMFVADMPAAAQQTRVYDEYLVAVATADPVEYYAVGLVGPRNRVDKLVKRLQLLP